MRISLDDAQRILSGSSWTVIEALGEGGGGTVFLCVHTGLVKDLRAVGLQIMDAVDLRKTARGGGFPDPGFEDKTAVAPAFLGHLLHAIRGGHGLSAVKIPSQEAMQSTESERFVREIAAMKGQCDPSLIRLLDHDGKSPAKWLAMEYHPRGDVERPENRTNYLGKPLAVLRALKPIAEGLEILHDRRIIHRDVKPKNIFVADDGHLVLGDFGIALSDDDSARLTGATIQSKDWVPDWVRFKKQAQYSPAVDVFMLARVAHFLISGEKVMSSQLAGEVEDLKRRFPDAQGFDATMELLRKCIVSQEKDCALENGGALADEIDSVLLSESATTQGRLVFSFLSESTSGYKLPGGGMPTHIGGPLPNVKRLSDVPVLVSPPARLFVARARYTGQQKGSIDFVLGGCGSNVVDLPNDRHSGKDRWSDPIVLKTNPLLGWQDLSVRGESEDTYLTGFVLYML